MITARQVSIAEIRPWLLRVQPPGGIALDLALALTVAGERWLLHDDATDTTMAVVLTHEPARETTRVVLGQRTGGAGGVDLLRRAVRAGLVPMQPFVEGGVTAPGLTRLLEADGVPPVGTVGTVTQHRGARPTVEGPHE